MTADSSLGKTSDGDWSLGVALSAARDLDVYSLAASIHSIGFECTRCGACCKSTEDHDHIATVFPDEIRSLMGAEYDWRDVAQPIPFGLEAGEGETFEWALQTDSCGDCVFYEDGSGSGTCTVYDDRPSVCRTYPFSVELSPAPPAGSIVDQDGVIQAHECEGLGRDITWLDAIELAREVKERTITDLEELIAVRDNYQQSNHLDAATIVHDSEGPKRPDGTQLLEE